MRLGYFRLILRDCSRQDSVNHLKERVDELALSQQGVTQDINVMKEQMLDLNASVNRHQEEVVEAVKVVKERFDTFQFDVK